MLDLLLASSSKGYQMIRWIAGSLLKVLCTSRSTNFSCLNRIKVWLFIVLLLCSPITYAGWVYTTNVSSTEFSSEAEALAKTKEAHTHPICGPPRSITATSGWVSAGLSIEMKTFDIRVMRYNVIPGQLCTPSEPIGAVRLFRAGGVAVTPPETPTPPPPPPPSPPLQIVPTSIPGKELGRQCKSEAPSGFVGNPIHAGTGNKFQTETDYVGAGLVPLVFKRYYNSHSSYVNSAMGAKWSHSYDRRIQAVDAATTVVVRQDGKEYTYTAQNNGWASTPDVTGRLQKLSNGWQYTADDDEVETYNNNGQLQSITKRTGQIIALSYTNGQLTTVTGPFGRTLSFTYLDGRIDTMADPAGGIYQYQYETDFWDNTIYNLRRVSFPDSTTRGYGYTALYKDSANHNGFPSALTGIVSENRAVYSDWTYDAKGRAASSKTGNDAVGYTLTYNDVLNTTTVTDPQGQIRTYHFVKNFDTTEVSSIDGGPCASCGGDTQSVTYDANGFVQTKVDHLGNTTQFTYNARGLQEGRTEAVGTPEERTIRTVWSNTFRLPVCKEEPLRTTLFEYNANGQELKRIEIDTTDGTHFPNAAAKSCASVMVNQAANFSSWYTRVWEKTYYSAAPLSGLLHTTNGPLSPDGNGVDDITTYLYNSSTGNLTEIQRPYGQDIRFTAYDAHGRVTTFVDANGLTSRLTYTPRGRVDQVEVL